MCEAKKSSQDWRESPKKNKWIQVSLGLILIQAQQQPTTLLLKSFCYLDLRYCTYQAQPEEVLILMSLYVVV